jgi:Domain of unknown function (DUF1874).
VNEYVEEGYKLECYIRHEATVKVINDFFSLSLTPSNAIYKYDEGDVLIVVTLKALQRGKEVQVNSVEDLDFYVVEASRWGK